MHTLIAGALCVRTQINSSGQHLVRNLELPECLELTISRGIPVTAVPCHSWNVDPDRYCTWNPSCSRTQVESWFLDRPDSNWAMQTGPDSGLTVLELDTRVCQGSLLRLQGNEGMDDWIDGSGWPETLQYVWRHRRFLIFRFNAGRMIRTVGTVLPGIIVHWNDLVFLPPSTFGELEPMTFTDPGATIHNAPSWLLKSSSQD